MKLNSIRDLGKRVNITDTTINSPLASIEYLLFNEDSRQVETRLTLGDLMLLYHIQDALQNGHDILITSGYKG